MATTARSMATSWVRACPVAFLSCLSLLGAGCGGAPRLLVAAGAEHTCVGDAAGVRCFGMNELGQLGDGTLENSSRSVAVVGMSHTVELVAGGYHTCAR